MSSKITLAAKWKLKSESEVVQSFLTLSDPCTVAYQAPPSMGFSRQEHWSGLPLPSLGDLPNPGIEPTSPEDRYFTAEPPGKLRDQKSEIQVSAGWILLRCEGVSDPCLSPTTQQHVVSSSA